MITPANKAKPRVAEDPTALRDLAAEINEHHAEGIRSLGIAMQHFASAGAALLQAKEKLSHGEWLPWLKANCSFGERTAQFYMRLARYLQIMPELEAKVRQLSLHEALRSLEHEFVRRRIAKAYDVNGCLAEFIQASRAAGSALNAILEKLGDEHFDQFIAQYLRGYSLSEIRTYIDVSQQFCTPPAKSVELYLPPLPADDLGDARD